MVGAGGRGVPDGLAMDRPPLEEVPEHPEHGRRQYEKVAPRLPEGPLDLSAILPNEGPLELDVGFGRGASLFARHEASPGSRILGVEIKSKWSYKVEARCQRLGLANVRVFAGDIRAILARSGPEGCLAKVFLHFPDPWWKKRHRDRLVLQPSVLDDLARLIASGGVLFVQTDVGDRMDLYESLVAEHEAFAGERVDHNPYGSVSNRERRAEADGLPVHRLRATRR